MNLLQQQGQKFAADLSDKGQSLANQAQQHIQGKVDDIKLQVQEHKPDFQFFLFVNTISGGNQAADFINLEAEKIHFFLDNPNQPTRRKATDVQFDGKIECEVLFYNLKEDKSRERGFTLLRKEQQRGVTVRAIVCGGDGTVMWVVDEMIANHIDIANCPIGTVPFGTGNDFARVTGWGGGTEGKVLGDKLTHLKKLVSLWVSAGVEDFDIWDIKIYTYEIGFFKKVVKKGDQFEKVVIKDGDNQLKLFKKKMSNYFSFGVDARIGYGFDKNRTTSQCGNKCIYCWEGCKKMFTKTPQVNNTLAGLEVVQQDLNETLVDNNKEEIKVDPGNAIETLFTTKHQHNQQQGQHSEHQEKGFQIKGNPVTLLCLNIPSYSGGAGDVWGDCQGKMGLVDLKPPHHILPDKFKHQYFGDGTIEFVCFQSIIGMANERLLHGQAERVAQGSGPFLFKFRKDGENPEQPMMQYFQIDGEYYQVFHPKYIKMRLTNKIPDGKIKVLVEKVFRQKSRKQTK